MIVIFTFLQGQKDLPTAFDKQDKDQFVADCKEVNISCCCLLVLIVLVVVDVLCCCCFFVVVVPFCCCLYL